jgi:hypothetical protein
MEVIKSIDIFGEVFNFNIFGKREYNTVLGGILTFSIVIITFVTTIMFGLDLILRTNPKVLIQKVVPLKYSYINCTLQNFPFFWRISDDNALNVNYSNILYPTLVFYVYQYNKTINNYDFIESKILPNKPCTRDSVQNDEYFDNYGLDNYYCLDWSDSGYPLGGFWDSGDMVYYLEQNIHTCPDGDRKSPNCTDQKTLKKFLGSDNKIYYDIYYPKVFFSPANFTNPIQTTIFNYYQMLSANLYKKNRYYFSENELESDKGWIFADFDKMSLIAYDSLTQDVDYKSDQDMINPDISSSLYATTIYLSKNHDKYILTYMKVQDLAAQVGGFIKILMVFCYIINYNINMFNRDLDVINRLFDFKKTERRERMSIDMDKSTINKFLKKHATCI